MDDLKQRGMKHLQKIYPRAVVVSTTVPLLEVGTGIVQKLLHLHVAYDPFAAIKQALIVVPTIGSHNELRALIAEFPELIKWLKAQGTVWGGNELTGHLITDQQMVDSPKVIIYTDVLHQTRSDILNTFAQAGHLIDLIHESELHSSVFISYGGPDETFARRIDKYLTNHTVETWFFPEDALPGQKLHRVMSDGVSKHDRVLLICSESSLKRPGVLNELERVLEREAREGGTDILIPISIDDYVFGQWAPQRGDLADQVRSRVIANFPTEIGDEEAFHKAGEKLLAALKK